jgi:hypothetical protein
VLTRREREALAVDLADVGDRERAAREALAAVEVQLRRDVDEARRRGLTWPEVAAALGVSKQAAHRRFRSTRVGYEDVPLS